MRFLLVFVLAFTSITSKAQNLYFPPLTGNTWDTLSPSSLGWCNHRIDSLYDYLASQQSKAFIVLKDGKIVLEKYFGTHSQSSLWYWASAGKTITAFMTGMAQQDGFLSISDTSSSYLGQGWTNCTPQQEEKITVWNQLSMTSGLDDTSANDCTLDTCLNYLADAGTRWSYHNAPYTLLDNVISTASGQTLNSYVNQRLKNPTGMTGSFVQVDFNNVYFSNARSMARFGLLMLNKGNWNGNQIMTDSVYFNSMINTSQPLNAAYGYLWWLNGKSTFMVPGTQFVFNGFLIPNAPADAYAALGKDGQILNVVPSKNMVVIRMGENPGSLPVPYLLNDKIWEYINVLECSTLGLSEQASSEVLLYPNPAQGLFSLQSEKVIVEAEVLDLMGKLVQRLNNINSRSTTIDMSVYPKGIYLLRAQFTDGEQYQQKIVLTD